jgi:general secretion pathway protein G
LELIFAVLIVLTLAAIAVPITQDYIYRAKVARTVVEIRGLEKEIIIFETERGRFPGWGPDMLETLQEIGRNTFLDPWGTPYQYRNLELAKIDGSGKPQGCRKDRSLNPLNRDFDLYSVGPDRRTQLQVTANYGGDDIIRAGNGSYVGEASKF